MILYKQGASGLTGRALGRELRLLARHNENVKRTQSPMLIRWGNDNPAITGAVEFNNKEAVAIARNKQQALVVLAAAGVRVPPFTDKAPAIGRTRYHQAGAGLVIWLEGPKPRDAAYFLEIIQKKTEFRVHVVDGKVIYTQRKVPTGEGRTNELIWNHDNGYRFIRILPRKKLSEIAIQAVQTLGLDFGAADILLSTSGHFYTVEVNTAPALEGSTLVAWTAALKELIRKE